MLGAYFFSFKSEDYVLVTQCTDTGSLPEAAFSDLLSCLGGDTFDYTFIDVRDWDSFEYYPRDGAFSLVGANFRPFILIPVVSSPL